MEILIQIYDPITVGKDLENFILNEIGIIDKEIVDKYKEDLLKLIRKSERELDKKMKKFKDLICSITGNIHVIIDDKSKKPKKVDFEKIFLVFSLVDPREIPQPSVPTEDELPPELRYTLK